MGTRVDSTQAGRPAGGGTPGLYPAEQKQKLEVLEAAHPMMSPTAGTRTAGRIHAGGDSAPGVGGGATAASVSSVGGAGQAGAA